MFCTCHFYCILQYFYIVKTGLNNWSHWTLNWSCNHIMLLQPSCNSWHVWPCVKNTHTHTDIHVYLHTDKIESQVEPLSSVCCGFVSLAWCTVGNETWQLLGGLPSVSLSGSKIWSELQQETPSLTSHWNVPILEVTGGQEQLTL